MTRLQWYGFFGLTFLIASLATATILGGLVPKFRWMLGLPTPTGNTGSAWQAIRLRGIPSLAIVSSVLNLGLWVVLLSIITAPNIPYQPVLLVLTAFGIGISVPASVLWLVDVPRQMLKEVRLAAMSRRTNP